LLTEVAATGVNVEDVAVDHAPGQEAGVVQLAVAPEDTARVRDALTDAGWGVDAT
jgi:prephenate dehydrogenase